MALIKIQLMECGKVSNELELSGDFEIAQITNLDGSQKGMLLLSAKIEKKHFIEAVRYHEVS